MIAKKKFLTPIYDAEVTVYILKRMKDIPKKHHVEKSHTSGSDALVFCEEKRGVMRYVICLPKIPRGGLLAHEITHLVNMIFEDRGIKLDTLNDEPQAYLTGWLFDKVNYFATKQYKKKKYRK